MAKLEGVKVIDMKDGAVERISYNGETYAKVEGRARAGDIVVITGTGYMEVKTGAFYEIAEKGGVNSLYDDGGDFRWGPLSAGEDWVLFRNVNVFTYEGEEYRKVTDRDAKSGDYVVFPEAPRAWFTANKPYLIGMVDNCGDPQIRDDDGDDYDTAEGYKFEVYEKVTPAQSQPTQTVTLKLADGSTQTFTNVIAMEAHANGTR